MPTTTAPLQTLADVKKENIDVKQIRVFGRCMSKQAYKAFLKSGILIVSPKAKYVPVFVVNPGTLEHLEEMNTDERRTLFVKLGVPQPQIIVIFSTRVEPDTPPQPQRAPRVQRRGREHMRKEIDTSWIFERKFESGTKVIEPKSEIEAIPVEKRVGEFILALAN